MNIIFDLDGTLIDSKKRLFRLFDDLVNNNKLSFDHYWSLKKKEYSHIKILKEIMFLNQSQIISFQKKWIDMIEDPTYLAYDEVIKGVPQMLLLTSTYANIYICTARQHINRTISQIENKNLKKYIKDILITEQKYNKYDLIKKVVSTDRYDWIIGDTINDIQVGKELSIRTCAVESGFICKTILKIYKPDLMLLDASLFTKEHAIGNY